MGDFQVDNPEIIDVSALRSLAASINASLDNYEAAHDKTAKTQALFSIAQDSQRLKSATTLPSEAFSDFTFQPLANGCVRIALSMGLFEHLPHDLEAPGMSVEELSKFTKTDMDLTNRVVRGLVAADVIDLDDARGLYSHTPMSLIYADPPRRAWAIWMWDVMVQGATLGLGPYFDGKSTLSNPTDPQLSPFTVGHHAEGKNLFEIVKDMGKLPLLNAAMSGSSVVCAKEAVACFDFASLVPGDDGVVLVDVSGAKGQTIQEIRRAHPALGGRMVLQDLQSVLDEGAVPNLKADLMPYDFFKEDQPVKGAAAYLYQRIFHDWSDADCQKILKSLQPAMATHSKLLICDVVVQDHRPHPRKVLRDLNMMLVGGMERSQQQWRGLLERGGFVVETFHGLQNADNSIIEARLK